MRRAIALVVVLLASCGDGEERETLPRESIDLMSTAFSHAQPMPERFTCDGNDESPPLAWSGPPVGTRELMLTMVDTDADDFVHWVLAGLDPAGEGLDAGATQGVAGENSSGESGYAGPCPPEGDGPHRYVFTLFALPKPSGLQEGFSYQEALDAAHDALGAGTVTGVYER